MTIQELKKMVRELQKIEKDLMEASDKFKQLQSLYNFKVKDLAKEMTGSENTEKINFLKILDKVLNQMNHIDPVKDNEIVK